MRNFRRLVCVFLASLFIVSAFSAAPSHAALYSFSSHTFTPCSTTGNSGPTLASCQTAYSSTSWKNDTSLFNTSSGIQLWTVPATGTYRITVAGAGGGAGKQAGGKGATISGEFALTQGAILKILIGQTGASYSLGSGGGGGGTFVVTNSNSPLIVAGGGGGGGGNSSASYMGGDATFTTTAGNAYTGGAGGTATAGGTGSATLYGGGGGGSAASGVAGGNQTGGGGGLGATGGAGFGGDGGNGQNDYVVPKSFINGGAGGYRSSGSWGTISTSYGGFGGGGNGTATNYQSGGGGGGGYAGGGGGDGLNNGGGGGGGSSYNSGSNKFNINQSVTGNGSALFELIASDTTPPTITSASSFSVNENSTTIATLSANETSTWNLSAGPDSLTVSIDTNTGVLRFKVGQNYESPSDADSNGSYIFTVRASDIAGNSSTAVITVTLLDVNDAPVITSNGGGTSASISVAENTSQVTTVTATDQDSASVLSYSVSGNDASDFQIDSGSGVLNFAVLPNYEAPADSDLNNIYLITVTVSDGSLIDTQTITITVTDLVDSVSISSPSFSVQPAKGATSVITYQVDVSGRATFFANGKKIPGCISKATTGTGPISTTCTWKPITSGTISIFLSIKPIGSGTNLTTGQPSLIQVGRRSGLR